MIDFLKDWVTNIIILVVLISFLEIILPSSSMKRYINMIIGLLIIIVLINPFIKLITNDINIEREVLFNILESNEMSNINQDNFSQLQDSQVIEVYKDSIRKEMINLISSKTKYKIKSLSVDIIEDKENEYFGEIQAVKLIIDNTNSNGDKNNKIIVKVDDVKQVSIKSNDELNTKNNNNLTEYNDLRRLISESYRIEENQVMIIGN